MKSLLDFINKLLHKPKIEELKDDKKLEELEKEIYKQEILIKGLKLDILEEQNNNIALNKQIKDVTAKFQPTGGIALILTDKGTDGLKWVSKDTKLSAHFKVYEFMQKDGMEFIKVNTVVLSILEKVRSHFGASVNMTSFYRSEAYNKAAGGVKTSHHIKGEAADFKVRGVNKNLVLAYVKTLPEVKYAYTNNTNMKYAVHINV